MMKHSHSGERRLKPGTLLWGCTLTLILSCSAALLAIASPGRQHRGQALMAPASVAPPYRSPGILAISGSSAVAVFARPLYPYSVIPGGLENAQELRRAVTGDSAVAQHYADFDLAKARIVSLDRSREAYVSYRIGNQIYWTNHKLTLAAGESLVTDGKQEARARCGNRISDVPQTPVSPIEPAEKNFDNALPLVAMSLPPYDPPFDVPLEPPAPPPGSASSPPSLPFDPGGGFPPFDPPIIGGGGGGSGGGGGGGTPSIPPGSGGGSTPGTPVVATPEPSSALLLGVGLVAVLSSLFFSKRALRKNTQTKRGWYGLP
jgi:hypothetical protein